MRREPLPLDKIRARHHALHQQIRALEQLLEQREEPDEARVREALVLFEGFEPILEEHFAVEEQGGYFSDVLAVAPRLTRWATRLERNHGDFRARLQRLLELAHNAVDAPDKWSKVISGVAIFLQKLKEHEAEENDLVRQAFMDDLAPGD